MSYWVIKRGDEYLQVNSGAFKPNRESAVRFFERPTHLAEDERRVYVRTRPPSERLYLCERVRELENELRGAKAKLISAEYQLEKAHAWKPVVAAAEEMRRQWESGLGIYDRVMAVIAASKRVPKEHRP